MMVAALGIGLGLGWVLPAQTPAAAAKGPEWKDTQEFDLAQAYGNAKLDDKGRLAALDAWKKYEPNSQFWMTRDELYMVVYNAMKDKRALFDKAKEIRTKSPTHYFAISTILTEIYNLMPQPEADLAYAEETGRYYLANQDKVFEPGNKPAQMADAQWTQIIQGPAKGAVATFAQQTIVYTLMQRKKYPEVETELTKVLSADPTQANSSYMLGQAIYNQAVAKKEPARIPLALFHFARAASYTGPNEVAAAQRPAILKTTTTIYTNYHGSADGLKELLELAKNNAMPPAGFAIKDVNTINKEKFISADAYDKAHPMETFWRDIILTPLSADNADSYFAMTLMGAGLPPAEGPFKKFKGKIVSMTPETSPTEVVLAVYDPNIPDAKLVFEDPLPGKMDVGSDLSFFGSPKSFTKAPFMVTFEVDGVKDLEGWTGTGPVSPSKNKQKAKAPATKGKGGAKGK